MEKRLNGYRIEHEHFTSARAMIETSDARDLNTWATYRNARTREGSWEGATWEKARDLLENGWRAQLKQIRKGLGAPMGAPRREWSSEVVGSAPIVPRALSGEPRNMRRARTTATAPRSVSIWLTPSASASVDASKITQWLIANLEQVSALEASGLRVRLGAFETFIDRRHNRKSYLVSVDLKKAEAPLSILRVAFPAGHPAFLRRICFDWYERLPNAHNIEGYGPAFEYANSDMKKAVSEALGNGKIIAYPERLDASQILKAL